jgi:hypothetical protein
MRHGLLREVLNRPRAPRAQAAARFRSPQPAPAIPKAATPRPVRPPAPRHRGNAVHLVFSDGSAQPVPENFDERKRLDYVIANLVTPDLFPARSGAATP